MGYLPAKKKGGRHTCGASISPCNVDSLANAISSDEGEDEDYLPSPAYKIVRITRPKKQECKVTLDGSFFAFLCPTTFDAKRFIRGHPTIYSEEKMLQFNAKFQKQLSFNFSAMCATCKKSKLMEKQLITKLDRTRLDKETRINRDDNVASCLFNGVHHIYNRINVAKS
jgi:hypothetical protein